MTDFMNAPLPDLEKDILADGVIDAEETTKLRERLYADDVIDREEADFLFRLNDATTGKDNDSEWKNLFVEAITDHVLKDEQSPGIIDDDEANYLIEKIQGDGQVDDTELALLVNICENAIGESPTNFSAFVIESLRNAVIADGIVDADEVEMLKKVIYGTGGSSGADVDRAEADLLFDINDATTGNEGHDPSWTSFFVEAISKHVLDDEASPGEIDEEEGDWLINRIEGDGEYDANEKALLANIKSNSNSIAGNLKFKIELFEL